MRRVCYFSAMSWPGGSTGLVATGGSGADRAFWVEGYGGRPFTIDRVKHPLPVIIPRLSIGVLGGVQPDRLADLIHGPDDGLQARFLWLWPEKVAGKGSAKSPDEACQRDCGANCPCQADRAAAGAWGRRRVATLPLPAR